MFLEANHSIFPTQVRVTLDKKIFQSLLCVLCVSLRCISLLFVSLLFVLCAMCITAMCTMCMTGVHFLLDVLPS